MTYAVRRQGTGVVEGVATRRLPFEPTGEMLDFRRDLRLACRGLVAAPGQVLHAVYTSADRRLVDLENVLTYNLGTAALQMAAAHGFVLERSYAGTGDPAHTHRHRYALEPDATTWTGWQRGTALCSMRFEAPFTTPTAGVWWLHARRGDITFHATAAAPPSAWLIDVTVHPPAGWRGTLLNLTKTLVDGAVSAMHSHRGPIDAVVARAAAIDPCLEPAEFATLLTEPAETPLGPTPLVVPRGAGLQWLPADDQIVGLAVRRTTAGAPGEVTVSTCTATGGSRR